MRKLRIYLFAIFPPVVSFLPIFFKHRRPMDIMNIVARTLEFITENIYYFINLFSKNCAIVSNAIFV